MCCNLKDFDTDGAKKIEYDEKPIKKKSKLALLEDTIREQAELITELQNKLKN